ncbi:hypothetical protein [Thermogymnomonas acidicola]|uniref:hypothetical protein n=1 Tax=Thermogymnomonas acidicola TaxID=399579 RepID=UPI0009465936|nr:hypothetical protein [Thermogymnomonas acidicola]
MVMIHPEVGINMAIFAMFFAILSTELMAASAFIFRYSEAEKKVTKYIIPIWEITGGTFFVFYAVNLEALIPEIIPFVAYTFVAYILVFLILYVLRNASIISAEFIWKNRRIDRKLLYRAYSVITYVLGVIVLIIYTSVISGVGIDFPARTFNLASFVSFLPNDGFIIGSAVLLFGMASIYYALDVNRFLSLAVVLIGMVIAGVSYIHLGDVVHPYFLTIPVVLTIAAPDHAVQQEDREVRAQQNRLPGPDCGICVLSRILRIPVPAWEDAKHTDNTEQQRHADAGILHHDSRRPDTPGPIGDVLRRIHEEGREGGRHREHGGLRCSPVHPPS